jgi:tRNA dimethylallyltransferase
MTNDTVVSIVGPTAVGKTTFALRVAEEILNKNLYAGVDLISADSRQVFKGLEIVSGADLPEKLSSEIKFHGVSIITPDQEWSVSHFQLYAQPIVNDCLTNDRLPIIIGGTGLYHDRLFETDPQLHVAPNDDVRTKAEAMSVEELQSWLREINSEKLAEMNNSDRNNPRRLARAIEIAMGHISTQLTNSKKNIVHQYVGLNDSLVNIEHKISLRVVDRFEHGAVEEVKRLTEKYSDWSLPAFSATGVKEIKSYLDKEISRKECLKAWSLREFQYAKRQLTWYKQKSVEWFGVTKKDWRQQAIEYILHL